MNKEIFEGMGYLLVGFEDLKSLVVILQAALNNDEKLSDYLAFVGVLNERMNRYTDLLEDFNESLHQAG